MKVKVTPVLSDSLGSHGLYSPWNSPGQNTGVGSLSLLQDIFPTQGSNPHIAGGFFTRWAQREAPNYKFFVNSYEYNIKATYRVASSWNCLLFLSLKLFVSLFTMIDFLLRMGCFFACLIIFIGWQTFCILLYWHLIIRFLQILVYFRSL